VCCVATGVCERQRQRQRQRQSVSVCFCVCVNVCGLKPCANTGEITGQCHILLGLPKKTNLDLNLPQTRPCVCLGMIYVVLAPADSTLAPLCIVLIPPPFLLLSFSLTYCSTTVSPHPLNVGPPASRLSHCASWMGLKLLLHEVLRSRPHAVVMRIRLDHSIYFRCCLCSLFWLLLIIKSSSEFLVHSNIGSYGVLRRL